MGFQSVTLLMTAVGSLFLGLLVFFYGKNRQPNQLLALFSIALAYWCFIQFIGAVLVDPSKAVFWTRQGLMGAILLPVLFLHFVFALIGQQKRENLFLMIIYGLTFLFILLVQTPLFVSGVAPIQNYRYYPQAGIIYPFFALFVLLCFVYGLGRLMITCHRSSGHLRNQLLYVIFASLVGFGGGMTLFFPIWQINFPVISYYTLPLYVMITFFAIIRHQLLDITIFFKQSLIYSLLTAFFTAFYAAIVLLTNYWLARYIQIHWLVTVFLVIFLAVIVFQPINYQIKHFVDRLFSQGEYRYQQTINDLSAENKKLFTSLLQADKMASLGTLAAGMAHEIKNPLAALKGMTQVLPENMDNREFLAQYQAVVVRQIDRINNIVETLLKYGQPGKLTVSQYNLNKMVIEVITLFKNQCQKQGIMVEQKLADLPLINGDTEQLTQVLTNLILNAIQAMPAGGQLAIRTQIVESRTQIQVEDTGLGISEERLARIFDPFYTTKEEGSGMGLAVAYRIIKEHGGEIEVVSQPGKGTKFTIWLPIRPERSV